MQDSEKFPDPFTPQHYKGLHLKLLILSRRFGIDFLLRYTVLRVRSLGQIWFSAHFCQ